MPDSSPVPSADSGPYGPSGAPRQPIEVERTYLRMDARAQLVSGRAPEVPVRLELLEPCTVAEWRALYRDIGRAWRWHDRDAWSDERLAAHLARAEVRTLRADATFPDGVLRGAGFVELERHADGSVEIVYLGLDQRAFGVGLGRWLVATAVEQAWAMGAAHVWLHTCTLDGPAALPNYLARGFTIERTERYTVD